MLTGIFKNKKLSGSQVLIESHTCLHNNTIFMEIFNLKTIIQDEHMIEATCTMQAKRVCTYLAYKLKLESGTDD